MLQPPGEISSGCKLPLLAQFSHWGRLAMTQLGSGVTLVQSVVPSGAGERAGRTHVIQWVGGALNTDAPRCNCLDLGFSRVAAIPGKF